MKKAFIIALAVLWVSAIVGCSSPSLVSSEPAPSDESGAASAVSADAEQYKPYEAVADFMRGESCAQLLDGFQSVLGSLIDDVKSGNVDALSFELEKCKAAGDEVPELYAINGDPKSCSLVCACARLLSEDEVSYLGACVKAAEAMKQGDESLALAIMDEAQPYIEKTTDDSGRLVDAYEKMAAEFDALVK